MNVYNIERLQRAESFGMSIFLRIYRCPNTNLVCRHWPVLLRPLEFQLTAHGHQFVPAFWTGGLQDRCQVLVFPKIEPCLAYENSDMLQIGVGSRWLFPQYINMDTWVGYSKYVMAMIGRVRSGASIRIR